jgi:hypothetical protein
MWPARAERGLAFDPLPAGAGHMPFSRLKDKPGGAPVRAPLRVRRGARVASCSTRARSAQTTSLRVSVRRVRIGVRTYFTEIVVPTTNGYS